MTLTEMKKKVLGLIEELNPLSEFLTDDPDIQAKINDVINQILYELARFKKIPKYIEMKVTEGDRITFADLDLDNDRGELLCKLLCRGTVGVDLVLCGGLLVFQLGHGLVICGDGQLAGEEVVAGVSVRDLHQLIAFALSFDIGVENNLHG